MRRWVTGLSPARDAHYYGRGPEPLMDTGRDVLAGLGVPDGRMRRERSTSGADNATAPSAPQEMTVEEDGRPVGAAVVGLSKVALDIADP